MSRNRALLSVLAAALGACSTNPGNPFANSTQTVVPSAGTLAPGKPANFHVLSGGRTVEAWVEGVRSLVEP